jgi:hypothetical protein
MVIVLNTVFAPPIDPPSYVLFYTAIFMIVFGTAAYVALRKVRDKKRLVSA